MNRLFNKYHFLFFVLIFSSSLYGQTNTDTPISNDMTFELKGDTLFSNTGLKIFVGQKFILGNPAGEEGTYRSIISRKAAIVPSIWGQDKRYEHAIENYVDSKKEKKKLKESLIPGNILTIKKIGFSKSGKPYFHIVSLSSDKGDYKSDIKFALVLKELLLSNDSPDVIQ